MPPCTAHNIVRRSRECGRISARKGQGRKSVLDARDLWALEGGCIQNRQDSVLEITAWAEDHFQKQDKMRFICTPVGVHRTRTLGCCLLTTVRHSTRSFPTNFPQKLLTLRLTPSLCNCVLDRPQGAGTWTSIIGTVSTGTPQGRVLSPLLYTLFSYDCVESVLTSAITVWYGNCTVQDRKTCQRVVKTAQNISGRAFPSLQDIYPSGVRGGVRGWTAAIHSTTSSHSCRQPRH